MRNMLKKVIALSVLAVAVAILATPAAAGVIVTSPDVDGAYSTDAPDPVVSFSDLSLRDGLKDASGRVVFDRLGLGHVHRTGCGHQDEEETPEVPEPATLLLLGSGLTGLALRRRRRQ